MTIKEYFAAGNVFIDESIVNAFDFLTSDDATVINGYIRTNYPRFVLTVDTQEEILQDVEFTLAMNKTPYNRLYRALQAQYELLETVDTETTNIGTSKNTGTQTNVGDTTTDSDGNDSVQNKMNAFNSTTPQDTSSATSSFNNKTTSNINNTRTDNLTRSDEFTSTTKGRTVPAQEIILKEIELIKYNLLQMIVHDIIKTTAITIY